MSRPLRIQFPGGLYHVTARGNGRQPLFTDDTDHRRFLSVLGAVVIRYRLLCHAYCLMGNHYHLLLETPDANLSRAMRQLNGVYSQRFNRRHERPGHVLEGRFHARVVDRDGYLREVCRYIVLNPVRAGLVAHPSEWSWSSYRATAGEGTRPSFLTVDSVLSLAGTPDRSEAERQYQHFVEAGLTQPDSPPEVSDSLFLGDAESLRQLRERIGTAPLLLEVPRSHRFALRPSLAEIFAAKPSRHDRDTRCVVAVREHGYTMTAVAQFLGVHYATVSRALAKDPRMLDCKT
jgi:REP element-mobilizing transposase RayT